MAEKGEFQIKLEQETAQILGREEIKVKVSGEILQKLEERIEEIRPQITNEIKGELGGLWEQIEEIRERIEVELLWQRLKKLEGQVGPLELKFIYEAWCEKVEERIEKLERGHHDLSQYHDILKTRVGLISREVDKLKEESEEIELASKNLEDSVTHIRIYDRPLTEEKLKEHCELEAFKKKVEKYIKALFLASPEFADSRGALRTLSILLFNEGIEEDITDKDVIGEDD